jgi:hypothetical protein
MRVYSSVKIENNRNTQDNIKNKYREKERALARERVYLLEVWNRRSCAAASLGGLYMGLECKEKVYMNIEMKIIKIPRRPLLISQQRNIFKQQLVLIFFARSRSASVCSSLLLSYLLLLSSFSSRCSRSASAQAAASAHRCLFLQHSELLQLPLQASTGITFLVLSNLWSKGLAARRAGLSNKLFDHVDSLSDITNVLAG